MGTSYSTTSSEPQPPAAKSFFPSAGKPLWPRLLSALAPAAPPPVPRAIQSLALADHTLYEGETRGDKAHGWGCLLVDDHRLEGQFAEGRPHGQVRISRQARLLYEGGAANGVPQGYGKFYGDNAVYEGQVLDGFCHGFGVLRSRRGVEYEGEFRRGRQDGRGTLKFGDGTIYIGEFKYGMRHGKGSFIRRGLGALETSWKSGIMDESASLIVRGRKIAVRIRDGQLSF